jgi:hypothetical protein
MEHLTKSQLILLALFCSFVTSIATGIVTVTLMDQAPPSVTQTINRIVERTVETIVPSAAPNAVKEQVSQDDFVVDAIAKNTPSVVRVAALNSAGVSDDLGLGVMLTASGLFVTDRAFLAHDISNLRITYGGEIYTAETVLSDPNSSLAFLKVAAPVKDGEHTATTTPTKTPVFVPAKLANSDAIKLGQTAIMLGGSDGQHVALGIVSRLVPAKTDMQTATSTLSLGTLLSIETNTDLTGDSSGGPMIATDSAIMGINIVNGSTQMTIPANIINYALGQLTAPSSTSATPNFSKISATIGAFMENTQSSQQNETQASSTEVHNESGSVLTQ